MGKKLGIISLVCALIFTLICIIAIANKPVIPDEIYDLIGKDQEEAMEKLQEIIDNSSLAVRIYDVAGPFIALGVIVLSIISIVKMVKENQKGKIMPILSMIIVILIFFVTTFNVMDTAKIFEAGFKYRMNSELQE